MAEYVLHCFAQSGNAYKPALMLELAGADWAPRFVDYFNGETRAPAYRARNVMGEVPLLEHRGRALSQSGVILEYLAGTLGAFGARDEDERREILRWILFDNHKLTSYTATYRFMRHVRAEPQPRRAGRVPEARGNGVGHPRRAPRRASRTWSPSDSRSPTSRCAATSSGRRRSASTGRTYPNLAAWLERIRAMPRWKPAYTLMPGHPRPATA